MTKMKPILFNTEMVKAILAGRKTVTRRVMKPQPLFKTTRKYIFDDEVCPKKWEDCDDIVATYKYKKGDILYVRETWCDVWDTAGWLIGYRFKAEGHEIDECCGKHDGLNPVKGLIWRPAIHMPKEVARIFLKVTDVRIQRLQHMDSEDAVKEGMIDPFTNGKYFSHEPMKDFIPLWDSTIKESDIEDYGWKANPWVWVIEFEKVEKPGGLK